MDSCRPPFSLYSCSLNFLFLYLVFKYLFTCSSQYTTPSENSCPSDVRYLYPVPTFILAPALSVICTGLLFIASKTQSSFLRVGGGGGVERRLICLGVSIFEHSTWLIAYLQYILVQLKYFKSCFSGKYWYIDRSNSKS